MGAFINLAGQKFGNWTVIKLDPKRGVDGETKWHCHCNCSNKRVVSGNSLRRGRSKSCGKCFWLHFVGQTFGRWTAIRIDPQRTANVICHCICGAERSVAGNSLKHGQSRSCGACYKTTHGMSRTSIYCRWSSMKQRCFNPDHSSYPSYGQRGVTVCDEWRDDFLAFFGATGNPPRGMSLDRINNDGNYEPGNVRWATPSTQTRNRRRSRRSK
jgi:hypothetical protein